MRHSFCKRGPSLLSFLPHYATQEGWLLCISKAPLKLGPSPPFLPFSSSPPPPLPSTVYPLLKGGARKSHPGLICCKGVGISYLYNKNAHCNVKTVFQANYETTYQGGNAKKLSFRPHDLFRRLVCTVLVGVAIASISSFFRSSSSAPRSHRRRVAWRRRRRRGRTGGS